MTTDEQQSSEIARPASLGKAHVPVDVPAKVFGSADFPSDIHLRDLASANAGLDRAAPLEVVTEAQIDQRFELDFKALVFTIQKAVSLMSKGATIVLTTSFLNTKGTPGLSVLSATKANVRSLARTLGAELAPRGMRINAISPGPISTPFAGKLGLNEQELRDVAGGVEGQVPLQRFGEADEVARTALFLASSDSAYMTGTEIVVDGGLSQF